MTNTPLTIDELRELISQGEAQDPLVFLESIMNGQDLRRLSSIHELILDIDNFSDDGISKEDWNEVVDHVSSRYKFHTVPLSESVAAAKTIAEYMHAKRKQVEMQTGPGSSVENDPLSEEEIVLFKERFNDEF